MASIELCTSILPFQPVFRGIQCNLCIVVTLLTPPVGCYTEAWSAYTVEPVYSGHPSNTKPVSCYTEVAR